MWEEERLHEKFTLLLPQLNERDRRLAVAAEAISLGHGGISKVYNATGIARTTITTGIHELQEKTVVQGRIRIRGGGRKKATIQNPKLVAAIEGEANPKTDKRTIVKWTSQSIEHITNAVKTRGFFISFMTVYRLLKERGYALKANKKDIEGGKDHPDRDLQLQHINMQGLKMQLVGSSRVDLQACKLEYSIVSPK